MKIMSRIRCITLSSSSCGVKLCHSLLHFLFFAFLSFCFSLFDSFGWSLWHRKNHRFRFLRRSIASQQAHSRTQNTLNVIQYFPLSTSLSSSLSLWVARECVVVVMRPKLCVCVMSVRYFSFSSDFFVRALFFRLLLLLLLLHFVRAKQNSLSSQMCLH